MMIDIDHVSFQYSGAEQENLQDFNLQIKKGECVVLTGESGCGKSTLGRTIIHLLESTEGKIILNGEDITRVNKSKLKSVREKMQIVFQDPYSSLNPRMTVSDIIGEPLDVHKLYKTKEERMHHTLGLDKK